MNYLSVIDNVYDFGQTLFVKWKVYETLLFLYFRPEHLQKILQTLSKLDLTTDSAHLLFVLSCHNHFTENITHELVEKLLKLLISSIEVYNRQTKVCYMLVYLIRILANCDTFYGLILNYCVTNNVFVSFKSVLNRNNVIVNDSLFWLLGNLYKYSGDDRLFLELLS